jgi:diguanylate cyclase (GGDEF)-like protein
MSTALPGSRSGASILVGTIWDELIGGLEVGVLLHDSAGAVLAANERAGELLGVPRIDLLNGLRPDGWQLCDDSGAALPELAGIFSQVQRAETPATGPFVITTHGEAFRRLWAEVYPVPLRGGQKHLLTVLHPVQVDFRRGKGLLDPLTGLPNRMLLFDRLDQALTRARTHGTMTSVVLADVGRLGEINRSWGFEAGDRLLTQVAERLRKELRADHTVARYSGGTFAVIADHPHGTAEPIAQRVKEIAETRVNLGAGMVNPTVRTGWASSDGNRTVPELLDIVETRLRQR